MGPVRITASDRGPGRLGLKTGEAPVTGGRIRPRPDRLSSYEERVIGVQLAWLAILVFALLVAIFAVQNAGTVDIRFLNWEFPGISLVYIILGSLIVGGLFVFFLNLGRQIALNRRLRAYQWENQRMTGELNRLRQSRLDDTQILPELDDKE